MKAQSLGQEDFLEKGRATHSSILVWRIPWIEEGYSPCRLQSMGLQRVRHDWASNTFSFSPGFRLEGAVDGMSCSQLFFFLHAFALTHFFTRGPHLSPLWTLEFASILLSLLERQQKMLQSQMVRVVLCGLHFKNMSKIATRCKNNKTMWSRHEFKPLDSD